MSIFLDSYIAAALWSSTDSKEIALDENYGPENIAPKALARMREDCEDFQRVNAMLLAQAGDESQNGHDFWLTRNHHGAGFWDRGYPNNIGELLTAAAHVYGSCGLYVGDYGRIYL